MNRVSKYSLLLIFCIVLGACSQKELAEPSCRVKATSQANHQGKGACVVVIGGNLMVNIVENNKFQLSIGNEQAIQSAQCSAHLAMFKDTGFNVEVEDTLGIQKDGTWLFACTLRAGFDGSEAAFEPPISHSEDIKQVSFIDPFSVEIDQWQNPDYFIGVRDAYVKEKQRQVKK